MKILGLLSMIAVAACLASRGASASESGALRAQPATNVQTFTATGVVRELKADDRTVVIKHEPIPNYMDAMTMPFKVKEPGELAGLRTGDTIRFCLKVTDTESWIERISRTGKTSSEESKPTSAPAAEVRTAKPRHPLLDYP